MTGELAYLGLFVAGLVAGALNVVAGGGSFLTLPLLIFAGLPPSIANATNRVGILCQNVGAVWGFHRHRVLDWRQAGAAAVPATLGAAIGTWFALVVEDDSFRKILALLMVTVSLWTLIDPLKAVTARSAERLPDGDADGKADDRTNPVAGRRWLLAAGFFAVGTYGGFVQAGAGFFILAVTSLAGLDLVRGNAVKVTIVLIFTALSLAIFAANDMVRWLPGLALAAGNLIGGLIGVRLTVLKGHAWVKMVVTVAVVAFAVALWLE
jgi:hypothetical protein